MASKVLVPGTPFAKLQVKKTPPESSGSGFIISSDAVARVAHLEHSVRFLQEQHRLMLSGLHAEIEALRERNRDLQFQLIFNKESSPKIGNTNSTAPAIEDAIDSNEEPHLKREVSRLERDAAAARGEARAAEARALQLQRLVDAQTEKIRQIELKTKCERCVTRPAEGAEGSEVEAEESETRAELRARLSEAERLVRRLRGDAERQRRELQCMKNSLHASLRATGLDSFGYQNNYHFPPVHTPDFWREPLREDFNMIGTRGRNARRPLTLPELASQQIHRSTVYANNHTRPRANGYEQKIKKTPASNGDSPPIKSPDAPQEDLRFPYITNLRKVPEKPIKNSFDTYPELKIVVTKIIPHEKVNNGQSSEVGCRSRPRRHHHRKHNTDHT